MDERMGQPKVPIPEQVSGSLGELSRQDVELLRLIAGGLPLDAIARRLHTSERTVRRRTKLICDRLGVRASIQAVVWAVRRGLV
jgi:DNA-binding NarL/FixJ family response regulator